MNILILSSSSRHFPLDLLAVLEKAGLEAHRLPSLNEFIASPLRSKPFLAILEVGNTEDIDRALVAYEWAETVQPLAPARYLLLLGSKHLSLQEKSGRFRGVETAQLPLPAKNLLFKVDLQLRLLGNETRVAKKAEGFTAEIQQADRERVMVLRGPGPAQGGWRNGGEAPQGRIRWRWIDDPPKIPPSQFEWSTESKVPPVFNSATGAWEVKDTEADLVAHRAGKEIYSAKRAGAIEGWEKTSEAALASSSTSKSAASAAAQGNDTSAPKSSILAGPKIEPVAPLPTPRVTNPQQSPAPGEKGAVSTAPAYPARNNLPERNPTETTKSRWNTAERPNADPLGADPEKTSSNEGGLTPIKATEKPRQPATAAEKIEAPSAISSFSPSPPSYQRENSPEEKPTQKSAPNHALTVSQGATPHAHQNPSAASGSAVAKLEAMPGADPKANSLAAFGASAPPSLQPIKEREKAVPIAEPPGREPMERAREEEKTTPNGKREKEEAASPHLRISSGSASPGKVPPTAAAAGFGHSNPAGKKEDPAHASLKPRPNRAETAEIAPSSSGRAGATEALASEAGGKGSFERGESARESGSGKIHIPASSRNSPPGDLMKSTPSLRQGSQIRVLSASSGSDQGENSLKTRFFVTMSLSELSDQNSTWKLVEGYRIYLSAHHDYKGVRDVKDLFPLWIYEGELAPEFLDHQKAWKFYDRPPNSHGSMESLPAPVARHFLETTWVKAKKETSGTEVKKSVETMAAPNEARHAGGSGQERQPKRGGEGPPLFSRAWFEELIGRLLGR